MRWTSIQKSEEEDFHVQVHEFMMRGTLTAKLFQFIFNPIVAYIAYISELRSHFLSEVSHANDLKAEMTSRIQNLTAKQ